jgi:RNase H-fold protein (predicted Holliday junction resolvase)
MKHPIGHNKKSKVEEGRMSVDAIAAAVILKEYLERRQTGEKAPSGTAS